MIESASSDITRWHHYTQLVTYSLVCRFNCKDLIGLEFNGLFRTDKATQTDSLFTVN